jgi:putative phage-type endonuclease
MEQKTEEWYQIKAGKASGSGVKNIRAKVKSGEAAGRRNYRMKLVMERLLGRPLEDGYSNAFMDRGTEVEPIARAMYENYAEVLVDEIAWVPHPTIENFGVSPDGLVSTDGLVEIKAPSMPVHIGYWLDAMDGKVPTDYTDQMLAQLACTGRQWCDFVSYDDRVVEDMQLVVIRFQPEKKEIETLEKEVEKFLEEVDKEVEKIQAKRKSL